MPIRLIIFRHNCRITFKQDAIMDIFNLNEKVEGLVSYLQETSVETLDIEKLPPTITLRYIQKISS